MWYSVMRALLLAVPLLAASCVTSEHLRSVEGALITLRAEVSQVADEVEAVESGAATTSIGAAVDDLLDAFDETQATVAKLRDDAESDEWTAEQVGTAVGGTILGGGGLFAGLVRLGTAMAARRVNEERDRRRVERGEPVGAPGVYHGPQDTVPPGGQNPG